MTRPERVLVTGGRGFLGSHVVRNLLATGRTVGVVTRSQSSMDALGEIPPEASILDVDLADRESCKRHWNAWKPDACIHLAWIATPGLYLDSLENLSSLLSTISLVQDLADAGCSRIAAAGTCAEYEDDVRLLTENSPTSPRTLYAATKLAAANISLQLARSYNLELSWGRVFYPYGPGEHPNRVIAALINALLHERPFPVTTGNQVRDYIYAEDVASAFVCLIDNSCSGIYNIASATPMTMRKIMEEIGNIIGRCELIRFGAVAPKSWDPSFVAGDNARLRATGWTPQTTISTGLARTVDWWRGQG